MATDTLIAPIPVLELQPGMRIVLEAIDPTTGSPVTGITVTEIAVYGLDLHESAAGLEAGPFMLVPGPSA